MLSQLKIYLLGSPQLESNGESVSVDTRKAIALMAYLAMTNQVQTRDALATLLWPDYEASRARAALRRTLSTLNAALDKRWLIVDRQTVRLTNDQTVWVDAVEFQQHLTDYRQQQTQCGPHLPNLIRAIELYRDDFMAGFSLRDSANFDDWQFFETENLRQLQAYALERVVGCLAGQGDFDPAIDYARRWLTIDPLHEPAHRALMQLYARSGQRAAMLRQYRECVRILDEELGVAPLEETTALYERLQHEAESPAVAAGWTSMPVMRSVETGNQVAIEARPRQRSGYPLVGRMAEWQHLLQLYQASDRPGHFMVIEGEAGVGKTRLAMDFLTEIQAEGAITLKTACYEGESGLAYNPFVECLRSAIERRAGAEAPVIAPYCLAEAVRLLPELNLSHPDLPTVPPLDNPGAQNHFFAGLGQLLFQLSQGDQPGVIFIDDLHWSDEASLDLLTYLVRRLSNHPFYILVTWREEQVPADHRLRALLAESQRSGTAAHFALNRLSRADVLSLVQAVVEEQPQQADELGNRLFAETEGLPFFLIEYLTAFSSQPPEVETQSWSMPTGVRDLLRSRLALADETGLQLLTTAAVIGRAFEFDTLRMASGRSEEETIIGLERLLALGMVTEIRDESRQPIYDFYHEKLRALVYEQASLARQRLLHRRVAEALINRNRGQTELGLIAGQIANHYRQAGQDEESADYFKQAGDYARSLFANAEALAHYRTALGLGYPESAELHESIGDLQTLKGDYQTALGTYERAAASLEASDLARLEHKLGEVYQRLGVWERAERHFQSAESLLKESGDLNALAHLYAAWSRTAHQQNEVDRAGQLARQALKIAEAAADDRSLAQAHNMLGILANSDAAPVVAERHLSRSLELAEQLGDPFARMAALNNLALTYRANGKPDQALSLTGTALELSQQLGDRHREAALHNNLADLYHDLGQTEQAMAHLKQAVTIFAEIGAESETLQPALWMLVAW